LQEPLLITTVSAEGGTMATATLTELLDREGIKYITIQHSPAFTAQEVAASAHVPGKEMAKTVVAKLDGKPALVVLPAREKVNLDTLRANTGAREVALAAEQEFAGLFPGCELGAMPPFGNLYGLDTYVTTTLAADDEIAFNAGTHTELIKMRYRDFERVVHPKQIDMSRAGRAD
jgi:Ala-tRNA(Pro) deacylase